MTGSAARPVRAETAVAGAEPDPLPGGVSGLELGLASVKVPELRPARSVLRGRRLALRGVRRGACGQSKVYTPMTDNTPITDQ